MKPSSMLNKILMFTPLLVHADVMLNSPCPLEEINTFRCCPTGSHRIVSRILSCDWSSNCWYFTKQFVPQCYCTYYCPHGNEGACGLFWGFSECGPRDDGTQGTCFNRRCKYSGGALALQRYDFRLAFGYVIVDFKTVTSSFGNNSFTMNISV